MHLPYRLLSLSALLPLSFFWKHRRRRLRSQAVYPNLLESRSGCKVSLLGARKPTHVERRPTQHDVLESSCRPTLYLVVVWRTRFLKHLERGRNGSELPQALKDACSRLLQEKLELHSLLCFYNPN